MKKVLLIKGKDPEEFVEAYNDMCANLKGIETVHLIDKCSAYVFYEHETVTHVCADCHNYNWNGSCEFCDTLTRPLNPACKFFNVTPATTEM